MVNLIRRKKRTRAKIKSDKIRISVFKSSKYIYAQAIDGQKVLFSAKDKDAEKTGQLIAKKCLENKIKKVVFDRGPYKYHGKVKALAEAARKEGLKF